MRKSKFSETQIVAMLKDAESGVPVADLAEARGPSRFSATHAEYLHAEKRGLRFAVWCLRANDREGHEESFLNEVRAFHVVPDFPNDG